MPESSLQVTVSFDAYVPSSIDSRAVLRSTPQPLENSCGIQQAEKAKCRLQQPSEVQKQKGNADDATRSFRQTHHNADQARSGLAHSKDAFHCGAVTTVLVLLFLCLTRQILIFRRLTQSTSGQADAMFFAKRQRLPVPLALVRQDALWIAAIVLPVPGYGFPNILRFICTAQNPAAQSSRSRLPG